MGKAFKTRPYKVGEVYYADFAKLEGFCDEAWRTIYRHVFAPCHMDDKTLLYGNWLQTSGVSINNCNDGIRTAVFMSSRSQGSTRRATICLYRKRKPDPPQQ